ncbi:MAG: hypothetical protein NXH78_01140 [Hyphomonadaceae bacterium]|nr:hypothetical protein [Hyphomonadaceae bacterium]
MLKQTLRSLIAGIAALVVPQLVAQAHEQAVGLTEIIVKPNAGGSCLDGPCRVEVAHRLSIHDAESTLMSVLGARADLVGDPAAQGKFATYVAGRFEMSNAATGEPLSLTLLGGEVERGYYWVYQDGLIPAGTSTLAIQQTVLMDAIPRQTNRVNVKSRGEIETLVFDNSSGPQSYSLP